ncbi:MAG: hypothetical protein KTR31_03105 [Myxococcales bacterium]|nr:hypothetical protein [Myxococcales bacterium]
MRSHIDIVSYLNMAWGSMQVLTGLVIGGLLALAGTGVGVASGGDEEALIIGAIYGVFGVVLGLISVVMGAVYLFVGWSMKGRKSWARIGGMVCAVFALLSIPLGTVLGIYTLVVLMDQEVADEFAAGVAVA